MIQTELALVISRTQCDKDGAKLAEVKSQIAHVDRQIGLLKQQRRFLTEKQAEIIESVARTRGTLV